MLPDDTIYLLDVSNLFYRAYHVAEATNRKAGSVQVTGVYVFTRMMLSIIDRHFPHRLFAALDHPDATARRRELYPDYKKKDERPPDDFLEAKERMLLVLKELNIPSVGIPGYEADDIIATWAKLAERSGLITAIIGIDKDLMQLVTPNVVMVDPGTGAITDEAKVEEKMGVSPDLVTHVQALTGDATDNVPGIKGVGPKIAARLILYAGSVGALLAEDLELPERYQKFITGNKDQIRLSHQLVTLRTDAPVELVDKPWRIDDFSQMALLERFKQWDFNIQMAGKLTMIKEKYDEVQDRVTELS